MNDIHELSDPQLDGLLRRHFPGAVPDDGFSARVMRALPPGRPSRSWLLPGAALAGSLLAWLTLVPSPLWGQVAKEWLAGDLGSATFGLSALLLGVTIIACLGSLAED